MKWKAPACSSVSYREPPPTTTPMETERVWGMALVMTRRPLPRTLCRNAGSVKGVLPSWNGVERSGPMGERLGVSGSYGPNDKPQCTARRPVGSISRQLVGVSQGVAGGGAGVGSA